MNSSIINTIHLAGITVSNREVPVGTEVILTCSVSGFSGTPTLEWTLGNQKLTSGDTYKITGETQGGAVSFFVDSWISDSDSLCILQILVSKP
jgi:hypothetical protein